MFERLALADLWVRQSPVPARRRGEVFVVTGVPDGAEPGPRWLGDDLPPASGWIMPGSAKMISVGTGCGAILPNSGEARSGMRDDHIWSNRARRGRDSGP